MKWSITLLLPLLVVMASCSTSARFSQQRFQDGIYVSAYPVENVKLKTEEDFQLEALRNICEKQMVEAFDSLKVEYRDVYPGSFEYSMYFDIVPLVALTGYSWAFNNWYWRRWHLGWSGYGPVGLFDPYWVGSRWDWYLFPFNDPFWNWTYYGGPYYHYRYGYYGPGYIYRPWYGPIHYGGGGFRNDLVYTPRNTTQPVGGYRGSGNVVRGSGYDGGSSEAPRTSGTYNYTPRRVSGVSDTGSSTGSGSRSASGRTYRPSTSGTASGSGSSSRSVTTSRRSSNSSSYSSSNSNSTYSGSRSSSYSSGSSSRGSSYSSGSSSRGGSSYSGGSHSGGGGGRSSGGSGGRR